jgi:hypothetical protein
MYTKASIYIAGLLFLPSPRLRIKMPGTQPALIQRRERMDCVKAYLKEL